MTTQTLRLLAVLLSDPDADWYGFELVERVGLKSGTLYPLLARLEQTGWLDSGWEDVDPRVAGRPRRRLYKLTGEGVAAGSDALDAHIADVTPASRRDRLTRPEARPA